MFPHCFVFVIIITFFFGYLFYITYTSKIRAACVIVPYNDGSKAPTKLSGRERSCLTFARSGMFGLGIAPKEKPSCLFLVYSTQFPFRNKTCAWKRRTILTFMFIFNGKSFIL